MASRDWNVLVAGSVSGSDFRPFLHNIQPTKSQYTAFVLKMPYGIQCDSKRTAVLDSLSLLGMVDDGLMVLEKRWVSKSSVVYGQVITAYLVRAMGEVHTDNIEAA